MPSFYCRCSLFVVMSPKNRSSRQTKFDVHTLNKRLLRRTNRFALPFYTSNENFLRTQFQFDWIKATNLMEKLLVRVTLSATNYSLFTGSLLCYTLK
mmetsp:Transcript_14886/g.17398  ORF Transcript_14886/g.17398 Transcript_14886/m.17398 type:complete len:97 (+) Transcript_14886:1240-1530(+)